MIDHLEVDKDVLLKIAPEMAWHYKIVPKVISEHEDIYFIDELQDLNAVKLELELLCGKKVGLQHASTASINGALNKYYIKKHSNQPKSSILKEDGFVHKIIEDAHQLGCSDIHIETFEDIKRVRFRLDGQLIQRYTIPKEDYPAIINKIKIMANLDISEKRLPQDGRILYSKDHLKFDIRVSSLPTLVGEKIVLRLLGTDASALDIQKLGFSSKDLAVYLRAVKSPNGIVLISGPTGSGKTTTLYATLGLLNQESKNILTIEDPIEYTLAGINQVQLRENIGLNFGKALRTFLRQDPDIIMVGEIRDEDTANMAIRASLTGHLVLSTIHTNSAWGIISRLIDMNIAPYLLSSTLNAVIAQRLLRKLCVHCKERTPLDKSELPGNNYPHGTDHSQFIPKGCNECFHTGYNGRVAIYEVIPIDTELSIMIKNGDSNVDTVLAKNGIKTLAQNALELFIEGVTSLEEIYPILSSSN
jgi:type IV pilus assembly protein PilB